MSLSTQFATVMLSSLLLSQGHSKSRIGLNIRARCSVARDLASSWWFHPTLQRAFEISGTITGYRSLERGTAAGTWIAKMSLILRLIWSPNSVGPRLSNPDHTLQWSRAEQEREDAVCTPGTPELHTARKRSHPQPGLESETSLTLRLFSSLLMMEGSRTKRATSFCNVEMPDLGERPLLPVNPRDG